MTRRYVDLSVTLDGDIVADPPFMRPSIEYQVHAETVPDLAHFFPGVGIEHTLDQAGFAASERMTLTTHNGTHMDAPWHYHPTMDGGKRAITIDEVPLEWCFGPGVKLDFRERPDGYVVTGGDVEAGLARIGHVVQPLDIVLVNTAAGAAYGGGGYLDAGCGMGRDATLYLTRRGVRVVGTDAWSWDAPFSHTARRVAETGDVSLIWEGHKAGAEIGYCQIEKLANLDQLPPTGFTVSCFPAKIKAASAGSTRAVAIFDD